MTDQEQREGAQPERRCRYAGVWYAGEDDDEGGLCGLAYTAISGASGITLEGMLWLFHNSMSF